jgi:Xaa-Pro aminopeptidase
MFNTVKTAQKTAITMIKAGANGHNIHGWIKSFFEKNGYKTGLINGQMQGFFHGTGHMLGLETHDVGERPLANVKSRLKKGYVTSVEPGLYYLGIGAVRIEDVVYVTKSGCEVLGGSYPNNLEIL